MCVPNFADYEGVLFGYSARTTAVCNFQNRPSVFVVKGVYQSKISIVPHSLAHMANRRAGNPVKTISEPGVVADFNAQNHCTNYLEPVVSSRRELLSDNPVHIRGDNSLVLFAIALIKTALGGLFLAIGAHAVIFDCE
jgi:hypothetical protein